MVSLSGLAVGLPTVAGSGGGPRGPDEIGRPGRRAAFPAVGRASRQWPAAPTLVT